MMYILFELVYQLERRSFYYQLLFLRHPLDLMTKKNFIEKRTRSASVAYLVQFDHAQQLNRNSLVVFLLMNCRLLYRVLFLMQLHSIRK